MMVLKVDQSDNQASFLLKDTTAIDPKDPSALATKDEQLLAFFGEVTNKAAKSPLVSNYMAKDFESFRQLILEHFAVMLPEWKERHLADLSIALVDLMAYVGDYLSYFQDSVANETYLKTARQRISIQRHARLLDYHLPQGCNSRTWIAVQVNRKTCLKKGTPFLSKIVGKPIAIPVTFYQENILPKNWKVKVFESLHDRTLVPEQNEMRFYDWGAKPIALKKGITRAALADKVASLRVGDVLVIKATAHITPSHHQQVELAHAVRLTQVDYSVDALSEKPITWIHWHPQDALPFDIYPKHEPPNGPEMVVYGNIVMADEGRTFPWETTSPVPESGTYRLRLKQNDLVFACPYDPKGSQARSAQATLQQPSTGAIPMITLVEQTTPPQVWTPQKDLLLSGPFNRDFVAEVNDTQQVALRFGDGRLGKKPIPGTVFQTQYRVSESQKGDIGAETLVHVVLDKPHSEAITHVSNPLGSCGFTLPQTATDAQQMAPQTFQTIQRCITEDDYSTILKRHSLVTHAKTVFRWTARRRTACITVLLIHGISLTPDVEADLTRFLEPCCPMGVAIKFAPIHFVALTIELAVQIKPHFFNNTIEHQLKERFSDKTLANGSSGFFAIGQFDFGQPVFLSSLLKTIQLVVGVERVETQMFKRFDTPDVPHLKISDVIALGPLEMPQVANKKGQPALGSIHFQVEGGK